MSRATTTLAILVVATGFAAGCLDLVVPAHQAPPQTMPDPPGGTPNYDMGHSYAQDPTTDGGVPLSYNDIQVQFDSLGCTTSNCHGGTQVPVLLPKPADKSVALSNYFDLISGCGNGTPDPSDCFDVDQPDNSLLLLKTCAASGTTHMGGSVFQDNTDPTYKLWRGWIAAGAPF
jgi:hypothetical protein